jgi:hypothetical protein
MSSINDGLTSQGATSRTFDKYGKRIWVSNVKKDNSIKHKRLSAPEKQPAPYDSSKRTSKVRC